MSDTTNSRSNVCIGFVSELSLSHRAAWSGTPRYMLQALMQAGGNVNEVPPIMQASTLALNRASKLVSYVTGKNPMLNRLGLISQAKAHRLQHAAQEARAEVLFAPVGSSLIARMSPGFPIAYSSDATVKLMATYYSSFEGMNRATLQRSISLEREAMQRAGLLIYPTQWAANSAIKDYGINPDRIMVQAFGANIDSTPAREDVLLPREPGPWRLLFCGVEWQRKGGEIVLEALELLKTRGIDVELSILGCTPKPKRHLPPNVTVIPFLNKTLPEDATKFSQIFQRADLLLLPTQAECYGLVFCEAAAYGTVSVATHTGGIPEVIRDGVTGRTVPPGQDPRPLVDAIADILHNPDKLETMRKAARDDFEKRLNWGVWGEAVLPRIQALATAPHRRSVI